MKIRKRDMLELMTTLGFDILKRIEEAKMPAHLVPKFLHCLAEFVEDEQGDLNGNPENTDHRT